MKGRASGILLHPTSLPGRFGIGDFGPEAIAFLDWMAAAGQSIWQVLPLGPTGFGNSPYGTLSAFAGNPLLISAERLVDEGLLPASGLEIQVPFRTDHADFAGAQRFKETMLRASWEHFRENARQDQRNALREFLENPVEREWLDDWALFVALKEKYQGAGWMSWDHALVARDEKALEAAWHELADSIEFHRYVQFLFFHQWGKVREEAKHRGIRVMGDVPIYVALDSADVWSHPELFHLDENHKPYVVAGVPPDYFSETGQRWGNPLYRWETMAADGYRWWIARVRTNLQQADLIRLDHFRGFAGYWEIPASEPTAIHGRWVPGPGIGLFEAIRHALGELPFIAEDLGMITHDVDELRHRIGAPGMKVLQFGFASTDNPHLPHHHVHKLVAYTGTHDNNTTAGWFAEAGEDERKRALLYLGCDGNDIAWDMIRAAWSSVANLAIAPIQDVLGLGEEARINTPGDPDGNWSWRVQREMLTPERAARLRAITEVTGRLRK